MQGDPPGSLGVYAFPGHAGPTGLVDLEADPVDGSELVEAAGQALDVDDARAPSGAARGSVTLM
jgi:hypothetical protein